MGLQPFQFLNRGLNHIFWKKSGCYFGQLLQSQAASRVDHRVFHQVSEAALEYSAGSRIVQQLSHGNGLVSQIQGDHLRDHTMRRRGFS